MRVDDVAFAMHEVGLLSQREMDTSGVYSGNSPQHHGTVIITRDIIESVVKERKIREKPWLAVEYVTL